MTKTDRREREFMSVCFCYNPKSDTIYSSLIFQSLIVLWVLSKLIPIFTSRLPSA